MHGLRATLIEGYKAGLLPRELVITELKERGVIGTDWDMPEVLAMLEADRRADAGGFPGLTAAGDD